MPSNLVPGRGAVEVWRSLRRSYSLRRITSLSRAVILPGGIFISGWIKGNTTSKITQITAGSHLVQITSAVLPALHLIASRQRPSLDTPSSPKNKVHAQKNNEKGSSCFLLHQAVLLSDAQKQHQDSICIFSKADRLPLALSATKAISNELSLLLLLIQGAWRLSEVQLLIHAFYMSPSGLWFQETSLPVLSLFLLCNLQECFSEGP